MLLKRMRAERKQRAVKRELKGTQGIYVITYIMYKGALLIYYYIEYVNSYI